MLSRGWPTLLKPFRVIILGMGIQGPKRQTIAGEAVVACVDPVAEGVEFQQVTQVPLSDFDAALVCTPDATKLELLAYLLDNAKHVLVEKPLLTVEDADLAYLQDLAKNRGVVCYTAYNHRFEPHFIRMKELIDSNTLGQIYSIRMFYGNGTARVVRNSVWRDQSAGVLSDLGSHLLDTLCFWFGDSFDKPLAVWAAYQHENKSFDHVIIGGGDTPVVQMEMSLLSWRNHFTADIYAENGSAHIDSLCKWGPSTFTHRTRLLPSGRPSEQAITLVKADPTWQAEYDHFVKLCKTGGAGNTENDLWLNSQLRDLAKEAHGKSALQQATT